MKANRSSKMVKQYLQDGYFVARDLLNAERIDAYLAEASHVLISQLQRLSLPYINDYDLPVLYQNLATLYQHDQTVYLATLRMFSNLKGIYDLFLNAKVEKICKQLHIQQIFFHTSPVFNLVSSRLRIKDTYGEFEAHQDRSNLQTSLNTITVWIPLVTIDRNLSPIEVIPGSHLFGLGNESASEKTLDVKTAALAGHAFKPVETKVCDVLFLSNHLIYRSAITNSEGLRLSVSWRYEDALERTYMERNYPVDQVSPIAQPLQQESFSAHDTLKKVYTIET